MDIQRDVVGFHVRFEFSITEIQIDIKEIDWVDIGNHCYSQSLIFEQFDKFLFQLFIIISNSSYIVYIIDIIYKYA